VKRDTLLFSGLNYATAFLPLLLNLYLARELGGESYGKYTLSLLGFNIFSVLCQIGTEKTLIIELSRSSSPRDTLIENVRAKFTLGSVLIVVFIAALILLRYVDSPNLYFILGCISGTIYAVSPRQWYEFTRLQYVGQFTLFIERIIFVIAAFAAVYFQSFHLVLVIIVLSVFTRILGTIVDFKQVITDISVISLFSWIELRRLIIRNFYVVLAVIGNLLMTQVNQLVMASKLGITSLAYFGIAMQMISLIRIAQRQLLSLEIRSLAEAGKDPSKGQVRHLLWNYARKSFLITGFLGILLIIIFPLVNDHLFSGQYSKSFSVMIVLIIWMFILGVSLGTNQMVLSRGLSEEYFKITLVCGVLSLFMSGILSVYLGVIGASLALLICHTLSVLSQLHLVMKSFEKKSYE
jgi:O-antigen/teichoic acid export membrane protein